MKKYLITLLFITFIPSLLFSQNVDRYDLDYRKFRVTLIPGVSTNGFNAKNYTARYSLNIIAGYHGGLDGAELGIININRFYARGIQIGGLMNATGGDMAGIQFAGGLNYAGTEMVGMQFSGLANIAKNQIQGIQISGLMNMSNDQMQGLQFTGGLNYANHSMQGIQLAGLANIAGGQFQGMMISGGMNISRSGAQGMLISGGLNYSEYFQGLSFAGLVNKSTNMQGIQIAGFANISETAQGIQIGIINFAQSFEGVPIGIFSYYGNGRKNADVWFNDGGFIQSGVKLGTRDVYNMVSFGFNPLITDRTVWNIGWSIGRYNPFNEIWDNPEYRGYFSFSDFTIYAIVDQELSDKVNTQLSYRYLFGKDFDAGISAYLGPSVNFLISHNSNTDDYSWYSIFESEKRNKFYSFWIGFSAGFQFFRH